MTARRRRRMMRRVCVDRGHAWHPVRPYSAVLMMGRCRCYRCGRYNWLTVEQIRTGKRQRRVAGMDPEWTQEKIRTKVLTIPSP